MKYGFLVPAGLEEPGRALLLESGLPASASLRQLPRGIAPPGYALGKSGETTTLECITSAQVSASVLHCSALMGALALVYTGDVATSNCDSSSDVLAAAAIPNSRIRSVFRDMVEYHRPDLAAGYHGSDDVSSTLSNSKKNISYCVLSECGGQHSKGIGARRLSVAMAEVFEGAFTAESPPGTFYWRVDLQNPDVLVLAILAQDRLTIGFLLPPFAQPGSHGLPRIPRPWFIEAARRRPHLNVARAACLVQLAGVESFAKHREDEQLRWLQQERKQEQDSLPLPRGESDTSSSLSLLCASRDEEAAAAAASVTLLDPLGGLGIIAIEAGLAVRRARSTRRRKRAPKSHANNSENSGFKAPLRLAPNLVPPFRAISMDMDSKACEVARAHARAAGLEQEASSSIPTSVSSAASALIAPAFSSSSSYSSSEAKSLLQRLDGDEHLLKRKRTDDSNNTANKIHDNVSNYNDGGDYGSSKVPLHDSRVDECVEILVGNALSTGLATGSIDIVLSELPFGKAYQRIDVGRLLRELHRLLQPGRCHTIHSSEQSNKGASGSGDQKRVPASGGVALIVGAEGGGGTARALAKAAALHPFPGAWSLEAKTPFAMGGIDVCALKLRRLDRKIEAESLLT